MLLAGVFFLFAIIGLLSELTAVVQHGDWRHLVLVGAFSGAVSAAYVVAIAGGPRWLLLVVVVQVALTMYIASWKPGTPPLLSAGPLEQVLTSRLTTIAGAIVACVSLSWAFLLSFITKSGRHYIQLDTELHLAHDIHRTLVPRIETRIGGFDFLAVSSPSGEVLEVIERDSVEIRSQHVPDPLRVEGMPLGGHFRDASRRRRLPDAEGAVQPEDHSDA